MKPGNRFAIGFFRAALLLAAVWLFAVLPGAAAAEGQEEPENPELRIEVETADATGSRILASDAAEGRVGRISNYAWFGPEGIPVIINTANGWDTVYSGDGARNNQYRITPGTQGVLYGLSRINHTHHACVRVESTSSKGVVQERYLWINALGNDNPSIQPAWSGRHMVEHGNVVSVETGIPNARVELTDLDGNFIIAATSDDTGYVIFDAEHSESGQDRYDTYTYSFGNYNWHTASAYVSNPANQLPAVGGTDHEWVANNSCATFQSRVLSAAGFPVYTPYTEGANSPGQGLWATLNRLIGSEFCVKTFTIDDFHEGDLIWINNMHHVMYCREVNREEGTIHVYAHSTSVISQYSDDCWMPITEVCALAMMVTHQVCIYNYRIDGVMDPRRVELLDTDGTPIGVQLITAGTQMELPDPQAETPWRLFLGWQAGEEILQAGESVTVTDHMSFTALWADPITEGTADLVLPASLTEIGEEAFREISATTVYIPDGCLSIGPGAFGDCPNLRQVRIPAGCAISGTAFAGCTDLTIFGPEGSEAEIFCHQHEEFDYQAE